MITTEGDGILVPVGTLTARINFWLGRRGPNLNPGYDTTLDLLEVFEDGVDVLPTWSAEQRTAFQRRLVEVVRE
jgi:hypothetical protein